MSDLIDKRTAIKIAESYGLSNGTTIGKHSGIADLIAEELSNLPTIEAEPVTSEWVWDDDAIDWGIGAYVCKRCHGRNENIHAGKQGNPYAWAGSQFCPKCGAKMKAGGQNEKNTHPGGREKNTTTPGSGNATEGYREGNRGCV